MVVAGASMFGLMVFTCVGRFRRKDESYDSCSWNTAYLKLALFLDVTYAIVFDFDWLCSLSLCLIYILVMASVTSHQTTCSFEQPTAHTHTWYFWKQHNIYRETRQIKTHSWLENIMWIYRKQQKFKQKKVTMKFRLRPKLIWVVKNRSIVAPIFLDYLNQGPK